MKITSEQLEAWERLAKEASRAPWARNGFGIFADIDCDIKVICYTANNKKSRTHRNEANAAFIAASRTAVPALIARVRELEKQLAEKELSRKTLHVSDRSNMPTLPFSDKVSDSMRME
jgi:hypothetical protein